MNTDPATPYDSTADTRAHIARVAELLSTLITNLRLRAINHDASKLAEPEKSVFDEYTPKLAGVSYGSTEYRAFLSQLQPALAHHYAHNSHHPEHYPEGVRGMDLLDVLEMLADWKAAGERHRDGSLAVSLAQNRARFALSDEMFGLLVRTAERLDWLQVGALKSNFRMKINARLLAKSDAITKFDSKGIPWLVGYRRRGSSRSSKAGQEFWLSQPIPMTPKTSMQCVNCIHAPHNLPEDQLLAFTSANVGVERPLWCPIKNYYPEEKCNAFAHTPRTKEIVNKPEPKQ